MLFPKPTKTKRKNTNRKLSKEIVEYVLHRDLYKCVLCGSIDLDAPHHVLFGLEAEYTENRNDANKLVSICRRCHYDIHHGTGGKELNFKCKKYLGLN